jgi:hypothetical protein
MRGAIRAEGTSASQDGNTESVDDRSTRKTHVTLQRRTRDSADSVPPAGGLLRRSRSTTRNAALETSNPDNPFITEACQVRTILRRLQAHTRVSSQFTTLRRFFSSGSCMDRRAFSSVKIPGDRNVRWRVRDSTEVSSENVWKPIGNVRHLPSPHRLTRGPWSLDNFWSIDLRAVLAF